MLFSTSGPVEYVAQLSKSFTVIILASSAPNRDVVLKLKDGWIANLQEQVNSVFSKHVVADSSQEVGMAGTVAGLVLRATGVGEVLANGCIALHPTVLELERVGGGGGGGDETWSWNPDVGPTASTLGDAAASSAAAPPATADASVEKEESSGGAVATTSAFAAVPHPLQARLAAAESASEDILAELAALAKRGRGYEARAAGLLRRNNLTEPSPPPLATASAPGSAASAAQRQSQATGKRSPRKDRQKKKWAPKVKKCNRANRSVCVD